MDMEIDEIFGESKPAIVPTKSAIYVWGYNQSGQTGRKCKEGSLRIPRQLPPDLFGCPGNLRWLDIACCREHIAAVASDGSLFTWGANEYGQLGDGMEKGRKYPRKVKQLLSEFVVSVSCGAHCTAAIAEPRENDCQQGDSGFGGRIRVLIIHAYSWVPLLRIRWFAKFLVGLLMWLLYQNMVLYKLGGIMSMASLGEVLPVKDCKGHV